MFKLQPVLKEIELQGFNSIYYFEFGKNFNHPPEKHKFWELVYVDSGSVLAVTDGNSCTLKQGQMIFHEPDEIHSHISDHKSPNNMLVIAFSCDSPKMSFFGKKIFDADKTIKTLLSLFLAEAKNALGSIPNQYEDKRNLDFSNSKFGSSQLLMCYFTEILINLMRQNIGFDNKIISNANSRAVAQNSICELIEGYMKENIYSNLTLDDICTRFMLGKSQLSHIFKVNTGKSLMEFYNTLKITEAKRLLREDSFSVSRISDSLGYSCIHSFSRAFKQHVGCSPTEYKKRIAFL